MDTLLDRFLRYVRIDTTSDEHSDSTPSSAKQLDLSRLLKEECETLGLQEIELNDKGVLTALLPGNTEQPAPTIVLVAHVDTTAEFSGTNVNPVVHENYAGDDITLPGDTSRVIRIDENPELKRLHGGTIITTDGTTLLGADDKSGVAVIMSAVAHLIDNPKITHCPLRLCFTCDEEIGRGVQSVEIDKLNAVCAYTLDSEGVGRIDTETFSADLAVVTVEGVNTHPSIGKGVIVNAIRILANFLSDLPIETLSPEATDGREGFLHPYQIEGGVAEATARILLRDFDTVALGNYERLLEEIAAVHRRKHPKARIRVEIIDQYRNMADGLKLEPRAVSKAIEATSLAELEPRMCIIRGGTDGSLLTERGLPTPNLSSGQHNPHSPLEWTSVEEMEAAVKVVVELAHLWGQEKV